jgi:ferrous iron transport protein B
MRSPEKKIKIALAGNANVGKSVIFNALTGLNQHVGNWPGKTVEIFSGTLEFEGWKIEIVDLPGIYSFSTYSIEEEVTREFIVKEKPDVVVNVVDASALERNLYFTLQLLELTDNVVVVLNQMDVVARRGAVIDVKKLAEILGVPVVPAIATQGKGLTEIVRAAIHLTSKPKARKTHLKYGHEIEKRIEKLAKLIERYEIPYPLRFTAIRLLEHDEHLWRIAAKTDKQIITATKILRNEIYEIHKENAETVLATERFGLCASITTRVMRRGSAGHGVAEKLDYLTTHRVYGYAFLILVLSGIFVGVFYVGSLIAEGMDMLFEYLGRVYFASSGTSELAKILWNGMIAGGIGGALSVVIPFVLPFYIFLSILEDTGYLARAAFLMDSFMHRIGLHGKAFIPLILGYGCNVPACIGCRIMETERERTLAAFLSTLIPCSARTVVILGVVGMFMGIHWALALYLLNIIVVFAIGKVASKYLPGAGTGLIMEIPELRKPQMNVVLKQSWYRVRDFLIIAMPIIIAGSLIIAVLGSLGYLSVVNSALSPVVVWWLGLPAVVGFTLIFGVLRKELTVVMLAAFLGTTEFGSVLSPVQMLVFTIVVMFYVPCIATIAALWKELGWKKALAITVFEIVFALMLGGIIFRVLALFM